MDMNLSKLWEMVKVMEACATGHGVAELDTIEQLSMQHTC
jgi:hypothetical protein